MFEQSLEDMHALVWFDQRDVDIASQEGIGEFLRGHNKMAYSEAVFILQKYDRALEQKHYLSKKKRIRSQRNSIVMAFGPDMVERVGISSDR